MTLEQKKELWKKIKKDLLELQSSKQVFSLLHKKYFSTGIITLKQQGDIILWWSKEQYAGRLKAEREKGNQLISEEDIKELGVEV